MMTPITIRLPVEMHRLIERMVKDRSLDGADKATVIRELIAEAIATRGAR